MPDGRVTVTADSIGGTPPLTSLELPDNGGIPLAEDWRNVAAVAFRNLRWQLSGANVEYSLHLQGAPFPLLWIGPPYIFAGNTWTNSALTINVLNAKAGDDLCISAWGTCQLNSISDPGDVIGELQLNVVEDVGGLASSTAVPGLSVITDDNGALATPHNASFHLSARHRVVAPGTARVTLQLRSQDVTGGGGTATLLLLFSARMDITHARRST